MFIHKDTDFIKPYFKLTPKGKTEIQKINSLYNQKMLGYGLVGSTLSILIGGSLLPLAFKNSNLKTTVKIRLRTLQAIIVTGVFLSYGHRTEITSYNLRLRELLDDKDNVVDDY